MQSKRTILITGATGLVGSYFLKLFLEKGHKVYVLARTKDKTAHQRVVDILNFWDSNLIKKRKENLIVLEGDITKEFLGLSSKRKQLVNEIEEIFHCAAVIEFNWPLDKIRRVNVNGTRNVLELGLELQNKGKLLKTNYISTAYVCGDHKGLFKENDLDLGQKFNTTYEQSKFEAEKLVERYRKKGLWIDIFRPPIVAGCSVTGKTVNFKGLYQTFSLWKSGIFDFFPGKDIEVNMVPVNLLCEGILLISESSEDANKNFHPFPSYTVSFQKIFDLYCKKENLKNIKLVTVEEFLKLEFTPVQRMLLRHNILSFAANVTLNSRITCNVLERLGFVFPELESEYLNKLFERTGI